jgi:hypothetical protein
MWKIPPMTKAIAAMTGLWLILLGAPVLATGEEAKTAIRPLILNLGPAQSQSYEAAFNQALREEGPKARPRGAGEMQPDGSVQYGSMTVTVKNPCPEGTVHYEPPPLPGRRAKR